MYILVTYDVDTTTDAGCRRLRKVARCCMNHGQRVQNSVFECSLTEAALVEFRAKISEIISPETDSIRIYRLGANYHAKIECMGKETAYDVEGNLII